MVAWQFKFAAGAMSIFAYAMSKDVRSKYTGPSDLMNRSLDPTNKQGFNAHSFWYAVAFPGWNGYRIEHDPVYTAYTNIAAEKSANGNANPGGIIVLGAIIAVVVVAIAVVATRGKGKTG